MGNIGWINTEEYSFDCMLLMERFQIRLMLESLSGKTEAAMAAALKANPKAAWLFERKCPEMAERVKTLAAQAPENLTAEQIRIMIRETCTAEVIHDLLSLLGLKLTVLWKGTGGMILFLLYVFFGNVPFILVQRYNRPRLKKLLRKVEEKENSGS